MLVLCLCASYQKPCMDKMEEARIFMGYNLVSKAYRFFQPQSRKVLVSRDVHFMENNL